MWFYFKKILRIFAFSECVIVQLIVLVVLKFGMLLHYVPPRLMFDLNVPSYEHNRISLIILADRHPASPFVQPQLEKTPEFKKRPNPLFAGKPHFWNIRNSVEVNVEKFKEQLLISSKGTIAQ